MKTIMQEVYENFNLMSDTDFKSWMLNTDLIKKENKIILDFTEKYVNNCLSGDEYREITVLKSASDYFDDFFEREMSVEKAIAILEQHNKWRKGEMGYKMSHPKDIGLAINTIVEKFKTQ